MLAEGADLEAPRRALEQEPDDEDEPEGQHDAAVGAAPLRDHGQARRLGYEATDRLARHGVVPGAGGQVLGEEGGDEIQHHGHEDLVDRPAGPQHTGHRGEGSATEGAEDEDRGQQTTAGSPPAPSASPVAAIAPA